jgi:hypothetical protein
MDTLRIKIIDDIPCIVLDEHIFCAGEEIERSPKLKKLPVSKYFTEFQKSKERAYYGKVLEELKKKFREK